MIEFAWNEKRLTVSQKMFKGVMIYAILSLLCVVAVVISFISGCMAWGSENLMWMYWTVPSAIFFLAIFAAIAGLGIWDVYQPNINRKGFLPIETSRGDRLFIGIISTIAIHLLWLALFSMTALWLATLLSIAWFYTEARWG